MKLRVADGVNWPDLGEGHVVLGIAIGAVLAIVALVIAIKVIAMVARFTRAVHAEVKRRDLAEARVHRESAPLDHDQTV